MQIGVIGCGTIATSIVTGLLTAKNVEKCHVTVRSSRNSARLLSQFGGDRVVVYDDAQKLLDEKAVSTVFVCLLPESCEEVLTPLSFDSSRQNVVSLVSTGSCAEVRKWTFGDESSPTTNPTDETFGLVSKMICLPSVATLQWCVS